MDFSKKNKQAEKNQKTNLLDQLNNLPDFHPEKTLIKHPYDQMIAMGIIGEYVWRTLDTVRNRPIYLIDKIFSTQNTENEKSS